ncbi:hypothetical protein J6T21_02535 [Candidatus Saccharibacteria bacterium]|nr:hypothetical protein [Candidatus Saccharibacteria bacterium]
MIFLKDGGVFPEKDGDSYKTSVAKLWFELEDQIGHAYTLADYDGDYKYLPQNRNLFSQVFTNLQRAELDAYLHLLKADPEYIEERKKREEERGEEPMDEKKREEILKVALKISYQHGNSADWVTEEAIKRDPELIYSEVMKEFHDVKNFKQCVKNRIWQEKHPSKPRKGNSNSSSSSKVPPRSGPTIIGNIFDKKEEPKKEEPKQEEPVEQESAKVEPVEQVMEQIKEVHDAVNNGESEEEYYLMDDEELDVEPVVTAMVEPIAEEPVAATSTEAPALEPEKQRDPRGGKIIWVRENTTEALQKLFDGLGYIPRQTEYRKLKVDDSLPSWQTIIKVLGHWEAWPEIFGYEIREQYSGYKDKSEPVTKPALAGSKPESMPKPEPKPESKPKPEPKPESKEEPMKEEPVEEIHEEQEKTDMSEEKDKTVENNEQKTTVVGNNIILLDEEEHEVVLKFKTPKGAHGSFTQTVTITY